MSGGVGLGEPVELFTWGDIIASFLILAVLVLAVVGAVCLIQRAVDRWKER